jgi:uncharacterized phage protein (TIGR01671 family)
MTEYLFRGRINNSGRWVQGDLYHHTSGVVCITADGKNYGIDPKTVGQYVGMNDDNAVYVFEGDILSVMNHMGESIHVVEDIFNFAIWYDYTIARSNSSISVIGNKYDNPELL